MKKYFTLILIILLFACVVTNYVFIEESILVKAELVRAKGSGYLNSHWFFTFENGITMRNFDTGYSLGKTYKIYYNTHSGKYKATLKESQ